MSIILPKRKIQPNVQISNGLEGKKTWKCGKHVLHKFRSISRFYDRFNFCHFTGVGEHY